MTEYRAFISGIPAAAVDDRFQQCLRGPMHRPWPDLYAPIDQREKVQSDAIMAGEGDRQETPT